MKIYRSPWLVYILKHPGVMRQLPGLTSLPSTLTAKMSTKIKFSVDKIYYIFSQEYPKITNMQNPHRPDQHFKKSKKSITTSANVKVIMLKLIQLRKGEFFKKLELKKRIKKKSSCLYYKREITHLNVETANGRVGKIMVK